MIARTCSKSSSVVASAPRPDWKEAAMRSTIVAIEEETTDRRSLTPSTTQRRMTTSRPSQNSRESISRRG